MIDLISYLRRIEASVPDGDRLHTLRMLQSRQVRTIPFENLMIMRKSPLTMDTEKLYEKLVTGKCGGVCYELNGFFHQVLLQLGYEPRFLAATTYNGQDWNAAQDTHMLNLVRIEEEEYIVDVGFGGNSPGLPVPLSGKEAEDIDGVYRVIRDGERYMLQKKESEEWRPMYRFLLSVREKQYFEPMMRYVEQSPNSPFNQKRFLSKVTDAGRVTLSGNSLTEVYRHVKRKRDIPEAEMPDVIERYFGILAE